MSAAGVATGSSTLTFELAKIIRKQSIPNRTKVKHSDVTDVLVSY